MLTPSIPAADGATVELNPRCKSRGSRYSDAAGSIEVGRVLRDRYVIQDRLGSGGRGTVFRVLDRYRSSLPQSEQYVALKVLHTGGDCTAQRISDLRRELHCAQVLSHQNIVNVFELDRDGDVVFFTMELLEGELLADVLARMRPAAMQRAQALQLIRQLGAGLAHAHKNGVVHGDLKPRNILITRDGQLRILDFGAARLMACAQPDERASVTGTPAYASCEILEGRPADVGDDLYALACICHELLGGTHPFAGRPATEARLFGIKACRPHGLTGRQWKTLQRGLSFHRAGRSMGVPAFMRGLTHATAEKAATTPLNELAAKEVARPRLRAGAAVWMGALVIVASCIALLHETSRGRSGGEAASGLDRAPAAARTPESAAPALVPAPGPPPADAVASVRPAAENAAAAGVEAKPPARRAAAPAVISVDGYRLSIGDHFVEIRVHRDQLRTRADFAWWTEPATAKRDVDYVHQPKAIQTFAPDQRSTRFYVKLLPDSGRSQRDYFYVAIAQPGRPHESGKVQRVQIWLPTARDRMQANR